jgi:hypothetical protein
VLLWLNPGPQTQTADPPRAVPREAPAVASSDDRIRERSEECARTSQDEIRRGWKSVAAGAAQDESAVEYAPHYNAKLDTCFLLLAVNGPESLSLRLYDVIERELYGEYLGPAVDESPMRTAPALCRVADFHCGSRREWEALVRNFVP